MADKAGFDEKRRLTNHSARKTVIQKLNDNNIPPTHIMQLSGQRNVQSVNNYSTVSNEQQKNMSLILSGNTTSTSIEERPVSSSRSGVASECCEPSFMKSSSFPAADPFSEAVFHGGQFNITISTVNKSPTSTDHSTHSTRSFKRMKRVFNSSDEDSATHWQTKLYLLTNFGFASFVIFKRAVPYLVKNWNVCYPLHQLWFLIGEIFTCRF